MNPKKKRYLLVQIIESKQNMMNAEPFSYLMTMKKKEQKIWKKKTQPKKKNHTKTARPNDPRRDASPVPSWAITNAAQQVWTCLFSGFQFNQHPKYYFYQNI